MRAHESQRLLAGRRLPHPLAARDDQGRDRADGFNPRASISTPEDERTGPGVTASTLIAGAPSAKRAAISNAEIGPAASSNWKSGNTERRS